MLWCFVAGDWHVTVENDGSRYPRGNLECAFDRIAALRYAQAGRERFRYFLVHVVAFTSRDLDLGCNSRTFLGVYYGIRGTDVLSYMMLKDNVDTIVGHLKFEEETFAHNVGGSVVNKDGAML